jgi:CRISPR-associated Cas5-like protein
VLGKKRQHSGDIISTVMPTATDSEFLTLLRRIIESPPTTDEEFTLLKKDIFHAFHMIPISVNHGLREAFLRALRDHLMRWDPSIRTIVDEACQKFFKLSFDQMLVRNPRFIAARTPRYVPPPSVIVPAIQHVYRTFGNAPDAKTGLPLFSPQAWLKANAVLELAREGYLSDAKGVVLYEKAGIDKYGLQKYKCLRGTNKVEGGPHGDIYRKFGALHGTNFTLFM